MSERSTVAHFLHDAGLAAWFGGSLMGAVGLNGAAAQVDDPEQRARAASAGWARWAPFNAAAIGAHLTGAALLRKDGKRRHPAASGNATVLLTAGALGATAYSRYLGQQVRTAGDVGHAGDAAQKQLKALQWATPGLTGAVLASSLHEEEQRPSQVLRDSVRDSVRDAGSRAASVAAPIAALAGARALSAAHAAAPVVAKAAERAKDALPV